MRPVTASAALDIRAVSQESLERIQKQLINVYKKYGADWHVTALLPPLAHDMNSTYLVGLADSIRAVTGVSGSGVVATGASDAANYYAHDIPCAVTRPLGGGIHTDDEWMDRQSFLYLVPILSHYLSRVAKGG